jgi:hypothetical protein
VSACKGEESNSGFSQGIDEYPVLSLAAEVVIPKKLTGVMAIGSGLPNLVVFPGFGRPADLCRTAVY